MNQKAIQAFCLSACGPVVGWLAFHMLVSPGERSIVGIIVFVCWSAVWSIIGCAALDSDNE